jgi:DNA-binding transcriptional LysR family regulator
MDRLDELALLVAILDGGTLAAGARKTRRSPAAVTRILSEFEARLGVKLVARTTRRLAATDAGRRLADHARRLLADYDDAVRDVMGEVAIPRGRLRISAPPAFGRRHIAPIVTSFLDTYPQVSVELLLQGQVIDLVAESVDVALRIGHLAADSRLVAKRVGQMRYVVVASPDYLSRHRAPKNLEQLAGHEIVLQSASDGPREWRFMVVGRGEVSLRPQGRLVVDQADTAIEAALAGRGLIQALSYQVVKQIASGELIRVLKKFEPPPMPVSLVFTATRFMPLRLRVFLDFAANALKQNEVLRRA